QVLGPLTNGRYLLVVTFAQPYNAGDQVVFSVLGVENPPTAGLQSVDVQTENASHQPLQAFLGQTFTLFEGTVPTDTPTGVSTAPAVSVTPISTAPVTTVTTTPAAQFSVSPASAGALSSLNLNLTTNTGIAAGGFVEISLSPAFTFPGPLVVIGSPGATVQVS